MTPPEVAMKSLVWIGGGSQVTRHCLVATVAWLVTGNHLLVIELLEAGQATWFERQLRALQQIGRDPLME